MADFSSLYIESERGDYSVQTICRHLQTLKPLSLVKVHFILWYTRFKTQSKLGEFVCLLTIVFCIYEVRIVHQHSSVVHSSPCDDDGFIKFFNQLLTGLYRPVNQILVPQIHEAFDPLDILFVSTRQLAKAADCNWIVSINHHTFGCTLNHELIVFLELWSKRSTVSSAVSFGLNEFLLNVKKLQASSKV